ncbi:MAG: DUF423 domain-containing protein [Saprospiraceae bacterium]|nr:DUF423 domain-containing protein [Saprospiraceae bacterium]
MKFTISAAGIMGVLAVILGAFGAHGLKPVITPDALDAYRTGVSYQFFHVFAIIACGILYQITGKKGFLLAAKLFIIGIILFSGSIYLLTTREITGLSGIGFLGPITPLGGLTFIAGWCTVIYSALKSVK